MTALVDHLAQSLEPLSIARRIEDVGVQLVDREAKADFIEVTASNVTYNFPGSKFSGTGSATIKKDKKLAEFAGRPAFE